MLNSVLLTEKLNQFYSVSVFNKTVKINLMLARSKITSPIEIKYVLYTPHLYVYVQGSSMKENMHVWSASQSASCRCVFHASKMHLKMMLRHYNWDHGQMKNDI